MRPDDRCKTSEMLFITIGNNKCHEKFIFPLQKIFTKSLLTIKLLRKLIFLPFFVIHWLKQHFLKHLFILMLPQWSILWLIVSKIFSFHKFVNNFDEDIFLDDYFILFKGYTVFPFVNKNHNHIITGKLKTINKNNRYANYSLKV